MPIENCRTLGPHLGFPSGIKNSNLVKDIPMIIHVQFGFSQFISFREVGKPNNSNVFGENQQEGQNTLRLPMSDSVGDHVPE
jgi:hypothetical protein